MCASTASGSPTSAASRRPIATSTRAASSCSRAASTCTRISRRHRRGRRSMTSSTAAETGVATYLVHLSSRDALAQLRSAKAERRATVYGETRPLYLYLTRERFEREDAALWVGQPPLRESADVTAVWRALSDGTCDTVGTDHIPRNRAEKLVPGLSFDKIPPGVSNLETLLPMLYSEGV